jgi:DNA-binding MarR family transcriptional regulator
LETIFMESTRNGKSGTQRTPGEEIDTAIEVAGSAPDAAVRAYLLFHYASVVVNRAVDLHLSNWGLSLPRYSVLRNLLARRELPLVELSRLLMCNASNINSVVGRLERDGLVKRRSNPHDGRSTTISLTPKGKKTARAAILPHREFLAQLMNSLDEPDLQQFSRSVEELISQAGKLAADARLPASPKRRTRREAVGKRSRRNTDAP